MDTSFFAELSGLKHYLPEKCAFFEDTFFVLKRIKLAKFNKCTKFVDIFHFMCKKCG